MSLHSTLQLINQTDTDVGKYNQSNAVVTEEVRPELTAVFMT